LGQIPWWRTEFSGGEADSAFQAISDGRLSQGPIVAQFEKQLTEYLGVRNVVATTSGSDALLLSLLAAGVRSNDEVLIPNRTWVATAHAALIIGANPVFVESEVDSPIISIQDLKRKITSNTKVVIPVHMNGRDAHIDEVLEICKEREITVIEDAAQALGSRDATGSYLGTKSMAGCFSLSVAKVISSGQGGFVTTDNDDYAARLRLMRTHGVENVLDPRSWEIPGFNFRFTDVLASIALKQLEKLQVRLVRLVEIYRKYELGLREIENVQIIPSAIDDGEISPYIEIFCSRRESLMKHLSNQGIESRAFYPDMTGAAYMGTRSNDRIATRFEVEGLYLPSGPSLQDSEIDFVLESLSSFKF